MSRQVNRLESKQVEERLSQLPEWTLNGDTLQRTMSFDNFIAAMRFVNRIADLAEKVQHHPDILIRYAKVTLTLSTHDADGITEKDFAFARASDELMAEA